MLIRVVETPWNDDQVASLNGYQKAGYVHEFTGAAGVALIATTEGWVEEVGGPVVQAWAHEFMTNWTWRLADPGFHADGSVCDDCDDE